MDLQTRFVHGNRGYDPQTGAISVPIYQCATFRHPGINQSTGYDYSRLQNPTREELEKTMALLEDGVAGYAFASGMAAITALMEVFAPGDHIIVSEDLYGGTYRLFEEIYKKRGLDFTYVDTSDHQIIVDSLQKNTKGIFVETPSNPMMKVTDLKKLIALSKEKDMITIVDNTFLTPYFQRPLQLGADFVVHSGTKYLGGHNDTLAGFIVAREEKWVEKLNLVIKTVGSMLSPFDSWLMLRGIKTLAVRLTQQQSNAMAVAAWLKDHPIVDQVYYVGLPDHPGYEISSTQAEGFGAMISFTVKDVQAVEKILSKVKIISFAESLGGVESLITYPMVQTHGAIPQEMRERVGVNETLLRISVGIESIDDLLADLEQAFEA